MKVIIKCMWPLLFHLSVGIVLLTVNYFDIINLSSSQIFFLSGSLGLIFFLFYCELKNYFCGFCDNKKSKQDGN